MVLENANETDIREEIAVPFLAALGYKRGTENDIARELPISYRREFLGRKKPSDPPLRGRPDYILTVTGAGRWVLEVKAPKQPIGIDAIEQAITYARHPEVSACYAVILNGLRLVVYHTSQTSRETPRIDLEITDSAALASKLSAVLSPGAIRRDCSPPMVDLALPLADGFRSSAQILGGQIRYRDFSWSADFPLPPPQQQQLDEVVRRMKDTLITVTGGEVKRDANSRIRAKLLWAFPNDQLMQFALDKRLLDTEYVALSEKISVDKENPTVFDVVGEVKVSAGESLFNILRWQTEAAGISMGLAFQGQATGFIETNHFQGLYQARYDATFPILPGKRMVMNMAGDFTVVLDPR